jgi:hypothetical protein
MSHNLKYFIGDLIDISPIDYWLLLRFAKEIIRKSSNNLIKQKKKLYDLATQTELYKHMEINIEMGIEIYIYIYIYIYILSYSKDIAH